MCWGGDEGKRKKIESKVYYRVRKEGRVLRRKSQCMFMRWRDRGKDKKGRRSQERSGGGCVCVYGRGRGKYMKKRWEGRRMCIRVSVCMCVAPSLLPGVIPLVLFSSSHSRVPVKS